MRSTDESSRGGRLLSVSPYAGRQGERPARALFRATLQVLVRPLVVWIWIGAAIIGLGALIALQPARRLRRRPSHAADPVAAAATAAEALS